MILSDAISINTNIGNDNSLFLEDVISSGISSEDVFMSDYRCEMLLMYKHELSFEESLVYELKFNRFSNKEISLLLDLPYKKVDNYLRKIKSLVLKYNLTL